MRWSSVLGCVVFMGMGIFLIVQGNPEGWFATAFFGLCLIVTVLKPWLPARTAGKYHLEVTDLGVVCVPPNKPRETIRWDEVRRVWYLTTSDGPWLPDQWIVLEGNSPDQRCSFPTEADGFYGMWDVFKQRFEGFNYEPLINGGTDDARHLCWERTSGSSK